MYPAIQTRYAGCHFRSRIEARWAVFFDALGLIWHYEVEGFRLPSGFYLPDFELPSVKCFIEVKGKDLSDREMYKVCDLAAMAKPNGWTVLTLKGGIPRDAQETPALLSERLLPMLDQHVELRDTIINAALECARSARFEYGETPGLSEAREIVAQCLDQFTDIQADLAWAEGWCFVCAGQHKACPADELNLSDLEHEYEIDFFLGDLPANSHDRLEFLADWHWRNRHAECDVCITCGCSGSRCSFEFPD
jgi:hypothetical protein